MEEKTKFLQASPGNQSNSRLLAMVTVFGALLMSMFIVVAGFFGDEDPNLIQLATAAGMVFVMIAGPGMAYSFGQKLNEVKKKVE